MYDSYIISFSAGSSGKFIKYILYSLLTDFKEEIQLTDVNSAHIQELYTAAPSMITAKLMDSGIVEPSTVYLSFNFDASAPPEIPKIMITHQYPLFKAFKLRFPNTNLILVTLTDEESLEVIGNNIYKNTLDMFVKHQQGDTDVYIDYFPWFKALYEKVLGRKFEFHLDIYDIERIVYDIHDQWKTHRLNNSETPAFSNNINLENYANLTEIKYSEIFKKNQNGKYIALEKLENLTNKVANAETIENYEKYVNGRNKFIQESMPWLLKEKPNN